ncbi:hypothetical protein [Vitiosangium sp. GDMCC 1.1324]|uniref:hypothetical protein n=1 Tax=Vitiosangium sp. (strain GDMCC 1.1324) TaxID=2138576 RepID=UPI000D391316|nr:hypothetical protein [Vitiosangium sp. GDMCC 1.1324]PTL76743.1 hypothetical protein DAT35_48310 [Vitiosangium sp. GDMCC 1.1324]
MNLYDESTIADAPWPDTEEGRKARGFLVPLFQQGLQAFFGDRSTQRLLAILKTGKWSPLGAVMLVTAAAQELLLRGVDASQLLRRVASAVEASSEQGGPEVAWAEGSRPEGISTVPEAARKFLQERLGGAS